MAEQEKDAHAKLLKVAEAVNAPEPTPAVQAAQLILAGGAMAAGIAIALILALQGPPAPKEPTVAEPTSGMVEPSKGEGSKEEETADALGGTAAVPAAIADGVSKGSGEGGMGEGGGGVQEGGSDGEEDSVGSNSGDGSEAEAATGSEEDEGESLANLSKQGPWAFAIVALLVATFIATGKSLNFSETKVDKTAAKQTAADKSAQEAAVDGNTQ